MYILGIWTEPVVLGAAQSQLERTMRTRCKMPKRLLHAECTTELDSYELHANASLARASGVLMRTCHLIKVSICPLKSWLSRRWSFFPLETSVHILFRIASRVKRKESSAFKSQRMGSVWPGFCYLRAQLKVIRVSTKYVSSILLSPNQQRGRVKRIGQADAVAPVGEGSEEAVWNNRIQLPRVTGRVIKPRLLTCLVTHYTRYTAVDSSFQLVYVFRLSTVDYELGCLVTSCTHWWWIRARAVTSY